MKEITQYNLVQGGKMLTCWLDAKLKKGDEITIKNGPEGWWIVLDKNQTTTVQ